jgi:DNA-binding transcriptional LysR family regulator
MTNTWTTLRKVEAFCAVVETGSWKAASARLGATSPQQRIAWHLVRDLEKDLRPNDPPTLFEKIAPGNQGKSAVLQLTAEGELVLPLATELLSVARSLGTVLAEHSTPLRLACYPAHLRRVVAPLLANGRIVVDVVADDSLRTDAGQPLFDLLDFHQTDLIIAPRRHALRVDSLPLYSWSLRAVIPIRSPLARSREPIDIQELAKQGLLVSPESHTSRQIIEQAFVQAGVPFKPRYESHSTESLLAYVDAGLGVAILPEDALWSSPKTRTERSLAGHGGITHSLYWRVGEDRYDERLEPVLAAFRKIAEVQGG